MNEKGFTLIEILFAMVVMTVGILALAHMEIAALTGNLTANRMTVAVNLAQDQIETLHRLPSTDADLADDPDADNNDVLSTPPGEADDFEHADPNNPVDSQGGTTGQRIYHRFWNIADDTPVNGTKTVAMFVYWGQADAATGLAPHRVIVSTTIAE